MKKLWEVLGLESMTNKDYYSYKSAIEAANDTQDKEALRQIQKQLIAKYTLDNEDVRICFANFDTLYKNCRLRRYKMIYGNVNVDMNPDGLGAWEDIPTHVQVRGVTRLMTCRHCLQRRHGLATSRLPVTYERDQIQTGNLIKKITRIA